MANVELLKKSTVQAAIDAYTAAQADLAAGLADAESAITNLQTNDQQVQDSIAEALASSDVDSSFISYTVGVQPSTSGASEGTIGAYFKDDGTFQKLELQTGAWVEIGTAVATKGYVDDKASLLAGKPVWLFVSKYNTGADYADLTDAYTALPATGGVILLDNIKKGDPGYTSPGDITKSNVTLFGISTPIIDFNADIIGNDCAVIEGAVAVKADNFFTQHVCYSTDSALLEGDCLSFPDLHYGAKVYDCAFIGFDRANVYHCLLIENQINVEIRNVQCLRNIWGVAIKASNCKLSGLHAKNNNNGPLVIKSDGVKTVENVICNTIYGESSADGLGDYYGILYIQNFEASSKLKNVSVSGVVLKEQYLYISNVNTAGVDGLNNIKVSDLHSDLSLSGKDQYVLVGSQPCDGLIQLSNISGEGSALYGINDANTAFSNIHLHNTAFDKPNRCKYRLTNQSFGTTFQKENVVHNTSTPLFSYTYDAPSFAAFDVTIGLSTVSCIAAAKFSIINGFSTGNSTQLHKQGFNLTDILLSLSIDTGTKTVTVSVTQTNVDSQTGTIYVSIVPRLVGGLTSITPL